MEISKQVYENPRLDPTQGADHFHTTSVSPKWSGYANMHKVGVIGDHIFYKNTRSPSVAYLEVQHKKEVGQPTVVDRWNKFWRKTYAWWVY